MLLTGLDFYRSRPGQNLAPREHCSKPCQLANLTVWNISKKKKKKHGDTSSAAAEYLPADVSAKRSDWNSISWDILILSEQKHIETYTGIVCMGQGAHCSLQLCLHGLTAARNKSPQALFLYDSPWISYINQSLSVSALWCTLVWDSDVPLIKKKDILICPALCRFVLQTGFQLFSASASTLFRWQRGINPASCPCFSWPFSTCVPSMLMRRQEGPGASSLICIDKIKQINNPRHYILSAISPKAEAHLLPAWSSPKPHCLAAWPGLWYGCQIQAALCGDNAIVGIREPAHSRTSSVPDCTHGWKELSQNHKLWMLWTCRLNVVSHQLWTFLLSWCTVYNFSYKLQLLKQCSYPCKIPTHIGGSGWCAVKHKEVGYTVQMRNTNGFYWVKAVLFSSFVL